MELKWLEIFLVLAETGSIRNAASNLGISPSALCANINALENYLGVKLFNKTARGSALTNQGEAYVPYARQLLKNWGDITSVVRETSEKSINHLSFVFHGAVSPDCISHFIAEFVKRHPYVVVNFFDDTQYSLAESMSNGSIDAFFLANPTNSMCHGLNKVSVFSNNLKVVLSAPHRLISKESVTMEDLEGETFILYPETREVSFRNLQLDLLRSSGIRHSIFGGIVSPSYYTRLVSLNYGVAIVPGSPAISIPPQTSLLNLSGPKSSSEICMVYHPGNVNSAFRLFLKEYEEMRRRMNK